MSELQESYGKIVLTKKVEHLYREQQYETITDDIINNVEPSEGMIPSEDDIKSYYGEDLLNVVKNIHASEDKEDVA